MKKLIFSFFLISFFLYSGCSWNKAVVQETKEDLLIQHLQKWQNFRAEGIIEANYRSLVFRKNIYLQKSQDKIEVVIFDSGIFGLKPEPFASVTIDTLISVSLPGDTRQIYRPEEFPELKYILDTNLLLQFKNEILKNNELQLSKAIDLRFSRQMQIEKITSEDNARNIRFFYQDDLSTIEVYEKNQLLLKIEIDKMSRE